MDTFGLVIRLVVRITEMERSFWFNQHSVKWVSVENTNAIQGWLTVYPARWKFWSKVYSERIVGKGEGQFILWYGEKSGRFVALCQTDKFLDSAFTHRNDPPPYVPQFSFDPECKLLSDHSGGLSLTDKTRE